MPNLVKFGVKTCYYLQWRNLPVMSSLNRTQIARRYYSKHVKNDTKPLGDRTKILQIEQPSAGRTITLSVPDFKESQEKKSATETQNQGSSGSEKEPPEGGSNRLYWLLLAVIVLAGGAAVLQNYNIFESKGPAKVTDEEEKKKRRVPATSAEIPKEVPYLLIGGGTASFAAFRAIKSHDPKAKVMLITDELEMPYMRPPLSKEIWQNTDSTGKLSFKQWNGVERSIFYEPDEFYLHPKDLLESQNGGVSVVRGYSVQRLDVVQNTAILSDGTEIKYGKVLIAPGSIPKNLDVFSSAPLAVQTKVTTFKTIDDYQRLLGVLDKAKSIAIVGGGFLGSELSCSIAKLGTGKKLQIFQIFHETGNMGKVLPEYLSKWTTERVQEEGVTVLSGNQVVRAEMSGKQVKLSLIDGKIVLVDHVVVAAGSEPNTLLAEKSNLELHPEMGGYIVNTELQARSNVYVAGDAANFYDQRLGRRRVEHHDHAVVSGRLAGENMVGLKKPYTHQSMFWSDLGSNLGYEAIGLVDSSLETVGVFARGDKENGTTSVVEGQGDPKEDCKRGVIFYVRDKRIVGVLLWNLFNRINIARKVINEDVDTSDWNEVAKLFHIYGHEEESRESE
ncbi:apoptosis-inducing factor 1, mitochondrial isoform X2 [Phlebotomus papatasi]|uniref:apoptosis-inducing factor 1, mitochondrial isoform X2 n=1 Tax=Phlebotomus papatasi TaxID=29031 RepID=UPI0024834CBB|nr:apoptosis-inducing factor 1, mitochondrial isoform X2 [Phlebotomus papatasi]